MNRQELGRLGEQLARGTLKKRGYRILETNFRCRRGEIDIVAQQNDCLVFVEVRLVLSDDSFLYHLVDMVGHGLHPKTFSGLQH